MEVQSHRQQVRDNLIGRANALFAKFDSLPILDEKPERNFVSKFTFSEEGHAVVMSKIRVNGMTLDHLQPWIDDTLGVMAVLYDRYEVRRLPDHEGHNMYHCRHRISDTLIRSAICCRYEGEIADGYQAIFIST